MLGKKTSKYKQWAEHAQLLHFMPKECHVVNTGSTPSYKAFDYNLWNVRGFNLGFQPQPLYYDFETLKKYGVNISKGAKICIGIEEFKFFVDAYDDEATDHKYYLWLDKGQIRTYDKNKAWLIKHAPIALHPKFVLSDIKRFTKEMLTRIKGTSDSKQISSDTEEDDIRCAKRRVYGWNKEFGWQNGQKITKEQVATVAVNEKRLSDMVDYCLEHGWTPILVVPPFSPNLAKLLSEDVLQEGLWKPLERVSKEKNISLINYYYDERFADYKLYSDALTFNDVGRMVFNKAIQEQIGVVGDDVMKNERVYKLRNGVEIPWISFGTGVIWKYTRNKPLFMKSIIISTLRSIKHHRFDRELKGNLNINKILNDAYKSGFRMFDSGRIYAHSEDRIGNTVSEKPDVLITTKCSWMDITRNCSPDDVAGNLDVSLRNIKRNQVDLYLIHWPEGNWLDTYSQIIEEYKKGRCRAFGACNMDIQNLEAIKDAGMELPMVMQTEMHPLCVRKELREYCQKHGIQLMAHTPTGKNAKDLREASLLKELKEKYNKSATQIIIRWHYQNKVIPVVSSFSKNHMREDLDIFDFELSADEMKAMDSLDMNKILLNSHGIDDPNYIYNY